MGLEKETKKVAIKVKDTPEKRAFWELAEATAEDVRNNYPDWKKVRFNEENRVYYSNL